MKTKYKFLLVVCTLSSSSILYADVKNIEWGSYGGGLDGAKYSEANAINPTNIDQVKKIWSWNSPDNIEAGTDITDANVDLYDPKKTVRTSLYESTPLMVNNYLYATTSLGRIAVLEPDTGKQVAMFDSKAYVNPVYYNDETASYFRYPPNLGWVHRGASYWEKDGKKHLIFGTADAKLIALNADFIKSEDGAVELEQAWKVNLVNDKIRNAEYNYSVTSPPGVCGDTIIVGASIKDITMDQSAPRGDVRAFNASTGEETWNFETIPTSEESNFIDSWLNGSWIKAGNTNVWTWYTIDKETNTVFLATGTPNRDFVGVYRPGYNLYAESLVALDCKTGEKRWHQQLVHHGLWDYDLPTPPIIVEDRVFQPTKQGFMYVFNKYTGQPIWEVVETEVPQSNIEGEQTAPTQPIPTHPKAFEPQGFSIDNDLLDFPWVSQIWSNYEEMNGAEFDDGPLFTPPTENSVIQLPGYRGGASWAGATYHKDSNLLIVSSVTKPDATGVTVLPSGLVIRKLGGVPQLNSYIFKPKPFFGRLTAYNTITGDIEWIIPLGEGPVKKFKKDLIESYLSTGMEPMLAQDRAETEVEELIDSSLEATGVSTEAKRHLGWADRGHMLSTPSLLVVGQEQKSMLDPKNMIFINQGELMPATVFYKTEKAPFIYFFDPKTGETLRKMQLEYSINAAPITYTYKGKQYITFATGGAIHPAKLVTIGL